MPPEGISSHSISKILLINIFNYIIISTTSYRLTSHETQTSTVLAQLWRFSSFKSVNYNPILWNDSSIWVWVNTYRYIFSGLFASINPSYDLGFTRGTRVLTHPHYLLMVKGFNTGVPLACQVYLHPRGRRPGMPRGPQDLAARKAWQKVSGISDAKVTEKCNYPLVMTNIAIGI